MNTIKYSDAKRDGTLYRFKIGHGYDSAVVEPNGFIRLIYGIKATTSMLIIKDVPIGTKCGTAELKKG